MSECRIKGVQEFFAKLKCETENQLLVETLNTGTCLKLETELVRSASLRLQTAMEWQTGKFGADGRELHSLPRNLAACPWRHWDRG